MGTIVSLVAWVLLAGPLLWELWDRPLASWTILEVGAAFGVLATTVWAVEFALRHRREDAA